MVRAFIAVPCPDELKKRIQGIQVDVSKFGKMKLVEQENIHMTLKFLGEVDDNRIDELVSELDFISENEKFDITLRGVGAFPSAGYVRVLWVGVDEGSEKLKMIQKRVDGKLSSHGFERDSRFHPHFTVARVKSIDKDRISVFLRENSGLELGRFPVRRIDLMKSKLNPNGPAYSIIHAFELS
jgi:2'-5' RNA ligase